MKTILTLTALLLSAIGFCQKNKDVNIDYMLRGHIYARSSIEDTTAPGGFGSSGNAAKRIKDESVFPKKGLNLKIDNSKIIDLGEGYNGYKFYIANTSDSIMEFSASDSRLSVIAEAYIDKKWQPIEYLPSSWCGNSYHTVYLKPGEFWEFDIPKFSGKIPVKIRYALKLGKNGYVYSNEIDGSINRKQLSEKQGHSPGGLMDPYND